ncbi:MAG: MFS transporter [Actinomycetota bacterium]
MDEPILPFSDDLKAPDPVALRRSIAPLLVGYLTFGQFWGVWVVLVTAYLQHHGLSEGDLGLQLAALSVIAILSMTLFSPRLQFLPLAVTLPLSLAVMGLGALAVALGSGTILLVGFMVLGAGNGLIDVFYNVAAQAIEAREHKPVLQWMHACYSIGGITGGIGAGLLTVAGVDFEITMSIAAGMLFAATIWNATSRGIRALPRPSPSDSGVSLSALRRSRRLIFPAVAVLFAFLVEGSMDIWSGQYIQTTLNASALTAGIAFAAFSFALAIGRLTAGRFLFRLGYDRTMLVSGFGAFAGGIAATLTGNEVVVALAFLVLGFFIASAAPAAFGLADSTDEDPALAVSAMSTVGYTGFVVGPPLMGWLAEGAGLRLTMGSIAVCTLGVAITAILDIRKHGTRPRPERATS